jgi:leader peptidase (prepilin peptidase)/N-methyltransferase
MIMLIIIAIIGWLMGILVNYLADILPFKRTLGTPVCDKCGNTLPVFSYFIWKQKCPVCGQTHFLRKWLVNIFFILASLWLYLSPLSRLQITPGLVLLAFFGVVTVIDIEHRVILHPVSIVGALLGLFFGVWKHGWIITLLGGAAGYFSMLGLYYFGILVVRLRAKRYSALTEQEALGFGDVNLGGVIGLMLGWPAVWLGLFIGILTAGVVSFFYILVMLFKQRYNANLAIPYGPFLIFGAVVIMFIRWLI